MELEGEREEVESDEESSGHRSKHHFKAPSRVTSRGPSRHSSRAPSKHPSRAPSRSTSKYDLFDVGEETEYGTEEAHEDERKEDSKGDGPVDLVRVRSHETGVEMVKVKSHASVLDLE